jgi:hypothetical protein
MNEASICECVSRLVILEVVEDVINKFNGDSELDCVHDLSC